MVLVRSYLEHCVQCQSLMFKYDEFKQGEAQRRTTRMIREMKSPSCQRRLKEPDLVSLAKEG